MDTPADGVEQNSDGGTNSDGGGVKGTSKSAVGNLGLLDFGKLNQFNTASLLASSFSKDKICEKRFPIISSRDFPSEINIMALRTQSSSWTRV